jgi:hypothetical protein
VVEETSRSLDQWQPLRQGQAADAPPSAVADDPEAVAAAEIDPARIVGFLRVEPCLFPLTSPGAFSRLVLGCCELLGAPLGDWCCSNAPTPAQQQRLGGGGSTAAADGSAAARLQAATGDPHPKGGGGGGGATARLFSEAVVKASGGASWFDGSPERWAFVRRLLEALVAAPACGAVGEELGSALLQLHARRPGATAAGPAGGPAAEREVERARAAAKELLSKRRDDLLLFAAYARLEVAAGNNKAARKVYESALSMGSAAAAGRSGSSGSSGSSTLARVAVEFADFELAAGGPAAAARAEAAVVAALGGTPFRPPPSKPDKAAGGGDAYSTVAAAARLSARRGFQDSMAQLLSAADGAGALDAGGAALVAASALLELTMAALDGRLSDGVAAARAVLRNVAAAVPESVRCASVHHERLAVRSCQLAVAAALGRLPVGLVTAAAARAAGGSAAAGKSKAVAAAGPAGMTPAEARLALQAALQLYPHNRHLLDLLTRLETASFTLTRLRRELHGLCERAPAPAAWLAAMWAEALRPGGARQLTSMMEAALSGGGQQQQTDAAHGALPLPPPPADASPSSAAAEGGSDDLSSDQTTAAAAAAAAARALAFWPAAPAAVAGCPSLWRLHVAWEVAQGRSDAAHRLLLRAAHACPGAKALWLAGLKDLAGGMGPRELGGLMGAMGERLVLRTEVLEVMLAALDSEGLAAGGV